VMNLAARHRVVFCAYAILHAIAPTEVTRIWFFSVRIRCWVSSMSSWARGTRSA
jgi:hypothetical protein